MMTVRCPLAAEDFVMNENRTVLPEPVGEVRS